MTLDELFLGSLMTQSDIQAALTAQGFTSARAGYLDELGSTTMGTSGHLPVLDANLAVGANLREILGNTFTETGTGYLAAAFRKMFDVATPTLTAASVNQTADVGAGVQVNTLPAIPPAGYGADANASNYTGAFPASTLVNAPRSGMSLADATTVLGPVVSAVNKLVGDEDIYVPVFKNHSARLCAYVALNGADIHQADVSSILYSIYLLDQNDPDKRTVVAGHTNVSLAPADVLFDTLQSDTQASEYNFRHTIPVSLHNAFTIAGRNYLVEYAMTPVVGERILVRFRMNVL